MAARGAAGGRAAARRRDAPHGMPQWRGPDAARAPRGACAAGPSASPVSCPAGKAPACALLGRRLHGQLGRSARQRCARHVPVLLSRPPCELTGCCHPGPPSAITCAAACTTSGHAAAAIDEGHYAGPEPCRERALRAGSGDCGRSSPPTPGKLVRLGRGGRAVSGCPSPPRRSLTDSAGQLGPGGSPPPAAPCRRWRLRPRWTRRETWCRPCWCAWSGAGGGRAGAPPCWRPPRRCTGEAGTPPSRRMQAGARPQCEVMERALPGHWSAPAVEADASRRV